MSYEEEEKPVRRIDLVDRERKKQQETNFVDWRTSSRITDLDAGFKAVHKAEKLRRESQVKQASTTTQLTQQQINERVARQDIIQQDVKAGTYNDPSKPYNKMSRWVEDGDPKTNARLRRRAQQ